MGPSAPSVHAAGSPLVFSPNRPCQLMRLSMAGCGIGDASVSKLWPTLLVRPYSVVPFLLFLDNILFAKISLLFVLC